MLPQESPSPPEGRLQAVIIAAGKGNRLRKSDRSQPKPLYSVAGLPIIERVILGAKKAGLRRFVVVVGYQAEKLRKKLLSHQKRLGVEIQFVENPEWDKANGFSVLRAKEVVSEDFILLMSDHIFDWQILRDLLAHQPPAGGVRLAVDHRTEEIFDETDATKVCLDGQKIVAIGKEIGPYHAIDTGIFYCTPTLFEALESVCRQGNGSLSEAIQFLARRGEAATFDIGERYWQDVDTPESLKEAEELLFRAARKPETDGFISSTLNRRVSGWISRKLVRLPITPNQITFSALLVGLASAYFVSRADAVSVALGGLLFQFASIYDGCDGEVAKIKFASSRFGEWLDTLCDNVTYLAFFLGVTIGALRQAVFPFALPVGIFAIGGVALCMAFMYSYLLRFSRSGSLVTIQKEWTQELKSPFTPWYLRGLSKIKFLAKRDFFAFFFMILCLFNKLHWILLLTAFGSHLTWIIFLTTKKEMVSRPALPVEE